MWNVLFRLPSASQKRACLSSLFMPANINSIVIMPSGSFPCLHGHFSFLYICAPVLTLSTTWNDLFAVVRTAWAHDNKSPIFSPCNLQNNWYGFNDRIVRTPFSRIVTWNNREIIAEKRSYIFRWRSLMWENLKIMMVDYKHRYNANTWISCIRTLELNGYVWSSQFF